MHHFIRICKQIVDTTSKAINQNDALLAYRYNSTLLTCNVTPAYYTNCSVRRYGNDHNKRKVSNIQDLLHYISNNNEFHLKFLTNILHATDFGNISSKDAALLLECCGSATANSCDERNKVCQQIYNKLLAAKKLDLNVYATYIKTCTENNILINSSEFISSMSVEPEEGILKLLLQNACKHGRIDSAYTILAEMKSRKIAADENVFNSLVFAHTLIGGLKQGESVIKTMLSAQLTETPQTIVNLLCGLIIRSKYDEFSTALKKYPIKLAESQVLQLLETLGLSGNTEWLTDVKPMYSELVLDREFLAKLKKLCIHLVHMGKPESAMEIFRSVENTEMEDDYGTFLLKEMLHSSVDIEKIIEFAKELQENHNNVYVLESLTEVALTRGYINQAWKLLKSLGIVRPHYFWPLLCRAGKNNGEEGVFQVLQNMMEFKVKLDIEGLELYVIPFCDTRNIKLLVKKLQNVGYYLRDIISPIVIHLIKNGKLKTASEVCKTYTVNIFGDKLINYLSNSWSESGDSASAAYILKRYCESSEAKAKEEIVAGFLIKSLRKCRNERNYKNFLSLLKEVHKHDLHISHDSCVGLQKFCSTCDYPNLQTKLMENINLLLSENDTQENKMPFLHPKDMNLEQLECHLIELQEKNMETRGVIRKLIQKHTNIGNTNRVKELYQQLKEKGYDDSPGIKSSVLHAYVLDGQLGEAMEIYKQLKIDHPSFQLDSFKILDLAKLMVQNDKFSEAQQLLGESSAIKSFGNRQIERNCCELLSACKREEDLLWLYGFLKNKGYCSPGVTTMEPLVRFYLNSSDVKKLVDLYVECSNKYNCTPLQIPVHSAVIKSGDNTALETIKRATKKVHGTAISDVVHIAALAEMGLQIKLKNVIFSLQSSVRDLIKKQCEKWVHQRNVLALQTLRMSCTKISENVIDKQYICECIMLIHSLNNDCESAVKFYEDLTEEELIGNERLEDELLALLKKYNYKHPITVHFKNGAKQIIEK